MLKNIVRKSLQFSPISEPLNIVELYNTGISLYQEAETEANPNNKIEKYTEAMQYLQCAMILGNKDAFVAVAKFYNDDPINIRLKDTGTVIDKVHKAILVAEQIQCDEPVLNIMEGERLVWTRIPIVNYLFRSALEAILKECNNEFQKQKIQCHFILNDSDMKSHIELNDFTPIELQEIPKQEPNMHTEEDNTSKLTAKNPHYFDNCCECIIT